MKIIILAILFVFAALQAAFANVSDKHAKAELKPTKDSKVQGIVNFQPTKDGVRVSGEIKNLSPGEHGFHIHEKGDCNSPDAKSAGEHFNPEGLPHGALKASVRHAGDFGNITADSNGVAKFDFVDKELRLSGDHSAKGKAVIVHAKKDDLKTQPSGDSGDRVACGVIL